MSLQNIKPGFLKTLVFIIVLNSASCKKFVDIDLAPNMVGTIQVFENDKTAKSAVNGVYYQIRAFNLYIGNGGLSAYGGLSADELEYNGASATVNEFYQNSLLANNSTVSTSLWSSAYRTIYQTNAVIEGLTKSATLTVQIKDQLLGEMKAVRAFYYFNLVNLFGDVPLALTTNYEKNAVLDRAPREKVYDEIIRDLEDAEALLLPLTGADKTRLNKWSVKALLARVYLYNNAWGKAETMANEVIASQIFRLAAGTGLNSVFQINSSETIWELACDNSNTAEGASFLPSTATTKPTYSLTASLLGVFEPGDRRKTEWIKSNRVSSINYYYPYKYKERGAATIKEYNVVLRLAEQYLIRAEALARQNKAGQALEDVNTIRSRAGLPDATAATQEELIAAIEQERRTEFFAEWGHRWFDLKRTGRADAVLNNIKAPNWQTMDALYPIPETQLQINTNLKQNPGYN
jgi:starch-binding outer membrane protein, SusD/RagB family